MLNLTAWSSGMEAAWALREDPAALIFVAKHALAAMQASCGAIMALRAGRALPAWRRATQKALGASWFRLAFNRQGAGPGANPRGAGILILLCALLGLGAMAGAVDGRVAQEAARLAGRSEGAAVALGIEMVYTALFSLAPLLVVSRALRDEKSAVGQALQEEAGFPLARRRALREAQELSKAASPRPARQGGLAKRL